MSEFNAQTVDAELGAAITAANKPAQLQMLPLEEPQQVPKTAQPQQEKTPQETFIADNIQNFVAVSQQVAEESTLQAANLTSVVAKQSAVINDAQANIFNIRGDIFSEFKALFGNDKFDFRLQKQRKQQAFETIKQAEYVGTASVAANKLRLNAARAPLDMLEFVQKLSKGTVDLKVSEMQLLMQNRALQKDIVKEMQQGVTFADAEEVAASGAYDNVLTQDFIFNKLADKRKIMYELEAAEDAMKSSKFKLADEMTESAFGRLGPEDTNTLLLAAKEMNTSVLNFNGVEIPVYKLEAHAAKLADDSFKRQEQLAERTNALMKYQTADAALVDGAISTALTTVNGVGGFNMPSAIALMNMDEDELIQQDLWNKLPLDVASALTDMLKVNLRLDEKRKPREDGSPGEPISQAELLLYNKKADELKAITKQHTDDFILSKDKKRQWAFRQLVANRMQVSDANQGATILAQTGLQQPSFNGSPAFAEGYKQFVFQYAKQQGITRSTTATDDLSEAQADKLYNLLIAKLSFGATAANTDFSEILRAINEVPADGYSVQETIINSQEALIFEAGVGSLAAEFQELQKVLYDPQGKLNAAWFDANGDKSEAQIVELLVQQGQLLHKDPTYYEAAFTKSLFKTLELYAPQMGGFSGINAQAFMKSVFPFEDLSAIIKNGLFPDVNETFKISIHNASQPKPEIDTTPGMELYNIYGGG